MTLTEKALEFATLAHGSVSQLRKYTGEDYIVHPIEVASIVKKYGGDEIAIASAYLHDVVEDTDVTIDDVRFMFGDDVADVVDGLTDVSVPSDGNRKVRKAIDRKHSASASRTAQFVKLADIVSNSHDIRKHDPSFAKVYIEEMRLLLDVLDKVSDTELYQVAKDSVS